MTVHDHLVRFRALVVERFGSIATQIHTEEGFDGSVLFVVGSEELHGSEEFHDMVLEYQIEVLWPAYRETTVPLRAANSGLTVAGLLSKWSGLDSLIAPVHYGSLFVFSKGVAALPVSSYGKLTSSWNSPWDISSPVGHGSAVVGAFRNTNPFLVTSADWVAKVLPPVPSWSNATLTNREQPIPKFSDSPFAKSIGAFYGELEIAA